jgi:serine/threonine-protein kinase
MTGDAAPPALAAGELVAERYRIVDLLGEGGMGAVYRVEHVHMRKTLALKVLHGDFSDHPEVSARFEREAIAAGNIEHPNVTAATDFGRLADGSFFLVLEYVAGRSLRKELERGPIDTLRALRILRGITSGLGAAHTKNIVHRDLKPENVMLVDREGDPDFVKILDFGIAKVDLFAPADADKSAQPLTRMGSIFGTPDYMSPEQALGQVVDARTDLYAAGVILFEILTGECPFRGGALTVLRDRILNDAPPEMPPDIAARVDARVHTLLRKLLMRSADARFQTAQELALAIDDVLAALAQTAPPPQAIVVAPDAMTEQPARAYAQTTLGAARAELVRSMRDDVRPALRDAFTYLRARPQVAVPIGAVVGALLLIVIVVGASSTRVARAQPVHAPIAITPSATPASPATMGSANATAVSSITPSAPELPPPPSASASASATAGGGGRKTGPGGIYIPPPSQWFK